MPATLAHPVPRSLIIYAAASRGDVDARAELKAMTPAERMLNAPKGLGGVAHDAFVLHGLTLSEQLITAKNSRERALLNACTRDTVSTSTNPTIVTTKEINMPATATKPAVKTPATPKTVKPAAKAPTGLTPRDLADELGTDPRTLRQVIRSLDLGVGRGSKYSFNKAQATKIRKAFASKGAKVAA
jgi:hypothetical protein